MKRMLLVLTTLSLGTILALAQTSTRPVSAFDHQLTEWQKEFLQAMQNNNTAVVEGAVADDFQGIGTNGDLYDKAEVVESAHEKMSKDVRAYDFQVIELNETSAIVAYNLITPGEHPRYRHMADTWTKIDGRWKLKFRQITPNLWSANDLE